MWVAGFSGMVTGSLLDFVSLAFAAQVRVRLIGRLQPCMTEIYLHIVARMTDYIDTHPYIAQRSCAG